MQLPNADLIDLLTDLEQFLDVYADVDDGPFDEMGQSPHPNVAMQLLMRVQDALLELENR